MHFKKNDKIDSYTVVFPHKQVSYTETLSCERYNLLTNFTR